ncbi:Uncharacterized protein HZ326_28012 [Fusarium oxysporum f. sp. albedinis]|nr:Uncharacterized protein HZ326_28012 [Fusarium oxysporum f. sp. albedinis]
MCQVLRSWLRAGVIDELDELFLPVEESTGVGADETPWVAMGCEGKEMEEGGVKYINRGQSLKHLKVPYITVPIGNLTNKKIPIGLSFCSKAYKDSTLLSYAFAYKIALKG